MAKMFALSRIPRRLPSHRSATKVIPTATFQSKSPGKIDVKAATPAAIETATVNT
jgi:hypothetical protein